VAATPHVLATAAGLDALRPGGSAVDGAIAANAAARGHARAIRIDHDSGFLEGGADPRGDGAAMGC
jgi:gamma-glutamyltranspeptidase